MYNEILPPIIEKQILEANECLVYKLLELSKKRGMAYQKRTAALKLPMQRSFQKSIFSFIWKI